MTPFYCLRYRYGYECFPAAAAAADAVYVFFFLRLFWSGLRLLFRMWRKAARIWMCLVVVGGGVAIREKCNAVDAFDFDVLRLR